jgi:biopolymer transport protein ExbD
MTAFYTGDHGAAGSGEHGHDLGAPTGLGAGDAIAAGFDRSAVMGDINVTPMVDVMLVLLIIFMVVTPALVAGFNAQLPQGLYLKERPEQEERTTLGVDAAGNYYLNTRPVPSCNAQDRATDAGKVACAVKARELLAAEFRSHPQDRVLFVKADRTLKYQEVIDVMRLAKESGARVIAAVTEQHPGAEDDDEEQAT